MEKTSDLILSHRLPINRMLTTLWALPQLSGQFGGRVQIITHVFFNPCTKAFVYLGSPESKGSFLLRDSSHIFLLTIRAPSAFFKAYAFRVSHSIAYVYLGVSVGGSRGVRFSVFCVCFWSSLFPIWDWFQTLNCFVLVIFWLA